MSVTDELLENNMRYAEGFDKGDLSLPPAKGVAVVACMDARLHVSKILGLEEGDAHIIRNAGGEVTDDAIRSLAISQRLLGTREIILIHHTGCGMLTFKDDEFRRQIQEETGVAQLLAPFSLQREKRGCFCDSSGDTGRARPRHEADAQRSFSRTSSGSLTCTSGDCCSYK